MLFRSTIIDIDANKFYLLGVAGKNIYGILNDPNLPNATSVSAWAAKTTANIYADILNSLFAPLASRSGGHITNASPLKMLVSPEMNVLLGKATDFNVSVLDMLHKYFTSLEIVVIPELHSQLSGETIFMVCPEVNGTPTGQLAFGDKMRMGRVIPEMSSFRQKVVATTYGGLVYQPFAFSSITGMA